jgi:hypothetical protein
MEELQKIQLEKIDVMHSIMHQMENDFFTTTTTSDFLKVLKSNIEKLLETDF